MKENNILQLLNLNLEELLSKEEDYKKVEIINGKIKFIDYFYNLESPQLGVFDRAAIRIFGEEKYFNISNNTHVTLTSSYEPDIISMIAAIENVIRIYKEDNANLNGLEDYEIDLLEKRDYWPGRVWDFNYKHGLWNLKDPEEDFLYSVTVNYDSLDGGFSLVIFGFNKLVEQFGTADRKDLHDEV
jgi:hypothetical protein